jgi:hypothetical protein
MTPGRPVPAPPPGVAQGTDTVLAQLEHAVARLDGLANLPVAEHVTRFEAAHAALTEALSSIDKV